MMRDAVLRLFNELPSLVVIVLLVAGVDQADYQPVIEVVAALGAFGTWLLTRRKVDGPVTVARGR